MEENLQSRIIYQDDNVIVMDCHIINVIVEGFQIYAYNLKAIILYVKGSQILTFIFYKMLNITIFLLVAGL